MYLQFSPSLLAEKKGIIMKNKIFFTIFMTVWLVIIVINFIWPKQVFSEEENRMLASIPKFSFESFVNGEYLNGVNDYINSHLFLYILHCSHLYQVISLILILFLSMHF